MRIQIPKKFMPGTTRIIYPTPVGEWSNTVVEGNFVVGDCASALYQADGVTKVFDWEPYQPPRVDYGVTMSALSFFDRMLDVEETFLREGARNSVEFDKLLSRIERLTAEVVLTRTDVINGVDFILHQMMQQNIDGYTPEFIAIRREQMFAPVTWDELPTRLQKEYPAP